MIWEIGVYTSTLINGGYWGRMKGGFNRVFGAWWNILIGKELNNNTNETTAIFLPQELH